MKVLLVRPPSFKMPIIIPNLGLGYLAAVLKKTVMPLIYSIARKQG